MKAEELKEQLKAKRKLWHELLSTMAGKDLVQWLMDNFDHHNLFNPDNQHTTAYRLGQRDVARLIKELSDNG